MTSTTQRDRFSDYLPLIVVALWGFAFPLAVWLGLSSRREIVRDVSRIAIGIGCVVSFSIVLRVVGRILTRRHERQLRAVRGEQTASDFVRMFLTDQEREAAASLYPRLQSRVAIECLPLRPEDPLYEEPLWLDEEDVELQVEQVCNELDICPALDRDVERELKESKTIGHLILAIGKLIQRQRKNPS